MRASVAWEVGVGHDDHVVLGAAQRLHALIVGSARVIDVLGDRGGADEADRRDVRMGEDGVDRLLVAVDDVEHAVGQAGLLHEVGDHQGGRGVLLRGLQDEGVAAGERYREHPHRHHGREVEGRDAGADADRLADRPAVDIRAHVLAELALQELRDAAGELHDLEAADAAALGVAEDLAVLGGDEGGHGVEVGLGQLLELEEDAGALQRRGGGPAGEGGLRRGDRLADLGGAGERHLRRFLAGGRVEHVAEAAGRALGQFAVDQ
jgi:hypothetical protein